MVISLFLFSFALLLVMAAVLAMLHARRLEQVNKVIERLEAIAFLHHGDNKPLDDERSMLMQLEAWLNRVGLPISPGTALAIGSGALFIAWFVLQTWGSLAALLWVIFATTLGIFIPQVRYRQKVNTLVSQIPLFIDQVIRGLVSGRNIEGAVKLASESVQPPLRDLIERVQRNVDLGADLGDAMRDAASYYDIKELHMLALAVHTSRVYGGSPREMLESIVSLIRQREQMQRELRAMTGETRVTAWVLGLMPILIVIYLVSTSPGYINTMWSQDSGRTIMLVAGTLQALGGLILWRMVKSI
jgi:tight adherence protein B